MVKIRTLYDKYFSSYCEKGENFNVFQKNPKNIALFPETSGPRVCFTKVVVVVTNGVGRGFFGRATIFVLSLWSRVGS